MVEINVQKFILDNRIPYEGDTNFLAGPTEATTKLWDQAQALMVEELKAGILDCDCATPSGVNAFKPGYLNKDLETIVGFQADAPLKRTIKLKGGVRVTNAALNAYGYTMDEQIQDFFTKYVDTHNDGVFACYTPLMRQMRRTGIVTGLPDGYGRGRIIGDYRRVALYGIDALIEAKKQDKLNVTDFTVESNIRLVGEITKQIQALGEMKLMGETYGLDMGRPAQNAQEAIQYTYMGYLAAVKDQDGAAMSFGRVDNFFDIYIEKDLKEGKITEEQAQEYLDHFVMKLRMIRHLRTPEYNDLFAGDPTWVTLVIGGSDLEGKHMVCKTSYRLLHTLYNLGPAPEPNITILWDDALPLEFRKFCARVSIRTSSIQYENDKLMRPIYGCDYGIACCVSAMQLGKQMQFFGARCNLAKLLLYVWNQGRDEVKGYQVGPDFGPISKGVADYQEVWDKYMLYMEWLMEQYVNIMNIIHFCHDRYAYEAIQMAMHDSDVHRFMAFGIAGLSVVADSFSAIKYAKVTPVFNEDGLTTDFKIEGEFPMYGNDDDRVDSIAKELVHQTITMLRKHKTYRDSEHTLSILTITSNIVYGRKTGSTPDGRKFGEPFAPGANPMHGRDHSGAVASLNSVAKISYDDARDGVSNTFSITPSALGKDEESRVENLVSLIDGYFLGGDLAFHINVNVLQRDILLDCMEHPEKYPNLTIRVSGYAVKFNRLTRAQQEDVINRTMHGYIA
eukprot:TRINITY_DN2981_c4_g1_i1.p1 TRINITY_DN2981_c4_g1~~TRINITY_DN2981_c4_g1_i1.p1  ORF type:complete len:732 (+),score=169.81 TRINITY_DN2981_c4_g1_i1:28-2223(+)